MSRTALFARISSLSSCDSERCPGIETASMRGARVGSLHSVNRPLIDARSVRYVGAIALFAAVYFAAAEFGLSYAFVQKNASPVWPPTGVAIGVMLVFGRRLWPGVFAGALFVNVGTGVPIATALGMAVGNTLEAVLAVSLLHRVDFHASLQRLRDIIAYIVIAIAAATVSATFGVASLALSRQVAWSSFAQLWTIWCVGDALGAILVGPFVLALRHGLPANARRRAGVLAEAVAILLILAAQALGTFTHSAPVAYTVFPVALWAVFRFGLLGATSTTLLVATIAVWGTAHGSGPFVRESVTDSLMYAQLFTGILAIMTLTLAATDAERTRAQSERARLAAEQGALAEAAKGRRRLELLDRATNVLIGEALDPPSILSALGCATLPELGDCYVADLFDDAGELHRVAAGHADPSKQALAEELRVRFASGGRDPWGTTRALEDGEPRLIANVRDSLLSVDQRHLMRELGTPAAITVPMIARGHTLGAVTFMSSRGYTDEDLVLARVVTERAALMVDNARLLEQARRAVHLREQVLGVVAHDLRAPLAVIRAQTDRISRASLSQPDSAAHAEPIARAAARMQRLIEDLVDVASIEAGSLSLRRERHDVASLVAEALEVMRARAEDHSLQLVTSIETVAPVMCDFQRVQQVLSNLVENAIKYTGPGGTITLRARVAGDEVELAVQDTGRGIPEDQVPHVFDRFWRAPGAGTRGAGLGLSIAKGIVAAHGGRLWCESTVGVGSTFFFTLPIARDAA